jgi:hypothetical protein
MGVAAGHAAEPPFSGRRELLALFRGPLAQPDPGAAAIFVDELDAGQLECPSNHTNNHTGLPDDIDAALTVFD